LDVRGGAYIEGTVYTGTHVYVGGGVDISRDAKVRGVLDVWNNAYIGGSVGISSNLDVRGNAYIGGTLYASSKSSTADTPFGKFIFYAQEATGHWFSDFGSGQLINGEAKIFLDPIFKEAISDKKPYIVLLSPTSESKGLYVAEKNKDYFVVRENNGGKSNTTFDYQIIGPRRGYEDIRLEKFEIPERNR